MLLYTRADYGLLSVYVPMGSWGYVPTVYMRRVGHFVFTCSHSVKACDGCVYIIINL